MAGSLGGDDDDVAGAAKSLSAGALTANLVTACLGTGILSLPWSTAGASLIPAAVLTLLTMVLNWCTNVVLVVAAEREGVFDLGALLGRLPGRSGPIARILCDLAIWVSIFLGLVGYIIVVADALELFLPAYERHCHVGLGVVMVLPLCFLEQRHLAFSSSLSILANLYLLGLVCFLSVRDLGNNKRIHESPPCVFGVGRGLASMFSCLMQAAIFQMCVLPMYEQLENRSPRRFASCLAVGLTFVSALFIVFSSLAYLTYGSGVSSNVLDELPDSFLGNIGRFVMAFAVLAVYPLMLTSMIAPIRHAESRAQETCKISTRDVEVDVPFLKGEKRNYGICVRRCHDDSSARRPRCSVVATVMIIICSGLGALQTRNLGKLNTFNGALQVLALVALVPSAVGLFLIDVQSFAWRVAMIALCVVGFVAAALAFMLPDNYSDELSTSCSWPLIS